MKVMLVGNQNGDFYKLPLRINNSAHALLGERVSSDVWHSRLGHLNSRAVHDLISRNIISSSCNKVSTCDSCFNESHIVYHIKYEI